MISKEVEALFEFKGGGKTDYFIFKLIEPEKILHARAILTGQETSRTHPKGTILKKRVDYNPDWSYHLDPSSIDFFSVSMEVCDANMEYIEEHLAEVGGETLPNSFWCPWNSKLVREIQINPDT